MKRRIMDMGIAKGGEVFVRKVAYLGDPIEIIVRGYELLLKSDSGGSKKTAGTPLRRAR